MFARVLGEGRGKIQQLRCPLAAVTSSVTPRLILDSQWQCLHLSLQCPICWCHLIRKATSTTAQGATQEVRGLSRSWVELLTSSMPPRRSPGTNTCNKCILRFRSGFVCRRVTAVDFRGAVFFTCRASQRSNDSKRHRKRTMEESGTTTFH